MTSKVKVKVDIRQGIECEAPASPWLRFCIGAGILCLCVTPLVAVVRWW
ncbi:hypothetical protein [Cupriavidus sp. CuC1]